MSEIRARQPRHPRHPCRSVNAAAAARVALIAGVPARSAAADDDQAAARQPIPMPPVPPVRGTPMSVGSGNYPPPRPV